MHYTLHYTSTPYLHGTSFSLGQREVLGSSSWYLPSLPLFQEIPNCITLQKGNAYTHMAMEAFCEGLMLGRSQHPLLLVCMKIHSAIETTFQNQGSFALKLPYKHLQSSTFVPLSGNFPPLMVN